MANRNRTPHDLVPCCRYTGVEQLHLAAIHFLSHTLHHRIGRSETLSVHPLLEFYCPYEAAQLLYQAAGSALNYSQKLALPGKQPTRWNILIKTLTLCRCSSELHRLDFVRRHCHGGPTKAKVCSPLLHNRLLESETKLPY